MGKIDDILVGLTERTDEGKPKWRTSANPDGFVAAVGDIAVVISRDRRTGIGADGFKLEILNSDETAVEAIETVDEFGLTRVDRRVSNE